MKYLLHGATDMGSSNYGDFLYGYLIYNYLKNIDLNNEIDFYNPSDYFVKYLNLSKKTKIKWNNYNCAIYIPGGYFGEGHDARFRDNLIQWLRFMIFGLKSLYHKKRLFIIAIGAGPINSFLMKQTIRKLVSKADFITVRDHESYEALSNLQTKSRIIESSDLIISQTFKFNIDKNILQDYKSDNNDTKILLVHYNHSKIALEKFAEAINLFLEKHKNYRVIVTSDCYLNKENELFKIFSRKINTKTELFHYDSPFVFTEFLKKVDLVLTCKLHLGVVSCMFNKSVIVSAVHPEKTTRFYKQIGEEARCVSLFDTNSYYIYELMEEYHDKKIVIPDEVIVKANITRVLLDEKLKQTTY